MNPQTLAFLPFVTPVATVVVVISGMLLTNHHFDKRFRELRAHMERQFDMLEQRLRTIDEAATRVSAEKYQPRAISRRINARFFRISASTVEPGCVSCAGF